MPGPVPTPEAVLKLRGSTRQYKCRNAPRPPAVVPDCPDWLGGADDDGQVDLPTEAQVHWDRVTPQLAAMGVLAEIDQGDLWRLCWVWARWRQAEMFIYKHGTAYPINNSDGTLKYMQQYPAVSIANQLSAELTRLSDRFGFTPSARARLNVAKEPAAKSNLKAFAAKRGA